ncbi:hypothetical protein EYF80_033469 [Liparis tanakae]|uniref:Uncharacterized protein n=1 Tax=Liparis tanakae TaxID=230148 RepID=A0A4Z2GRS6_9TELE|nr:hypothetical protein EYF80_033469 [Liparis tanakae]
MEKALEREKQNRAQSDSVVKSPQSAALTEAGPEASEPEPQ